MVRKRLAKQDVAYSDTNRPTRRVGIPPGFSSNMTSRIFEELLAGVETSYHEVDNVFGDNCHQSKRLLRDNVNDMQIDLFYGKIMPFEVDAISDAWWQRWHKYKGQCTSNNEGNTIAEKFGLEMRGRTTNTTATFYDQQILRRYVEKDRVVIVWRAYIEPLEFEKRPVSGMYFLEKGYVLITPVSTEDNSANSDNNTFSRVSTCYMLTPKSTDRKLRHDSRTTSLVDFVANTVSTNMSLIIEMVENMLLDQSISKSKRT
ncbi:M96 mating-specific protein [Phytophthora megakarya]|uniref:M96 mating-specific protein n=1 Tax=Phytophthora megakarya TaxID=4795 RepID=A0A225VCC5_9STRA|nr:M96 mating-specific protein [Phytophthora megakarya]